MCNEEEYSLILQVPKGVSEDIIVKFRERGYVVDFICRASCVNIHKNVYSVMAHIKGKLYDRSAYAAGTAIWYGSGSRIYMDISGVSDVRALKYIFSNM